MEGITGKKINELREAMAVQVKEFINKKLQLPAGAIIPDEVISQIISNLSDEATVEKILNEFINNIPSVKEAKVGGITDGQKKTALRNCHTRCPQLITVLKPLQKQMQYQEDKESNRPKRALEIRQRIAAGNFVPLEDIRFLISVHLEEYDIDGSDERVRAVIKAIEVIAENLPRAVALLRNEVNMRLNTPMVPGAGISISSRVWNAYNGLFDLLLKQQEIMKIDEFRRLGEARNKKDRVPTEITNCMVNIVRIFLESKFMLFFDKSNVNYKGHLIYGAPDMGIYEVRDIQPDSVEIEGERVLVSVARMGRPLGHLLCAVRGQPKLFQKSR
jgi:hypothetical protein